MSTLPCSMAFHVSLFYAELYLEKTNSGKLHQEFKTPYSNSAFGHYPMFYSVQQDILQQINRFNIKCVAERVCHSIQMPTVWENCLDSFWVWKLHIILLIKVKRLPVIITSPPATVRSYQDFNVLPWFVIVIYILKSWHSCLSDTRELNIEIPTYFLLIFKRVSKLR